MADASTEALIVRNIADFDAAARLMEERIEPMLQRAIERIIEEWAEDKGWGSQIDGGTWDKEEPFVFAPDWQRREEGEEDYYQEAWFNIGELEVKSDSIGGSSYWTARLCGVGGSVGFWWDWLKDGHGYKGRQWKAFVASYVSRLQELGFTYDESYGQFFVQVRVGADELARAIEDGEPGDALAPPINAALDICLEAKPLFDEIITAAKQRILTSSA